MATAKKNDSNVGTMVGVGAGVAAMAAAGYFLFGPNGKKNQKKIKGWTVTMKGEVLEKLEAAKDLSEPVYNQIIESVAKKYTKQDQAEVATVMAEMKKYWKSIMNHGKKPKSSAKKVAQK